MVHSNRCHKQYTGEAKPRLKTVLTNIADQLSNKQTILSLLQSQNIFFFTNNHNVSDMLLIPLVKSNLDSVHRATNQIKSRDHRPLS